MLTKLGFIKMGRHLNLIFVLFLLLDISQSSKKTVYGVNGHKVTYEPTWESLDARPLPSWYDESKIGIFIHWGVFSVPSFWSEWFWNGWKRTVNPANSVIEFMKKNYPPGFSYQDFGPQFTAEFYNATKWTQLFQKSGARYVVLTSKHHEGYTMWPSKYSFGWNSMDVGPHRNLLGGLVDAIRLNSDLRFGLYHSLYEWFNPLWISDKNSNLTTDEFVRFKTLPELYELVYDYKPEIVWSDGEWDAPDSYWKSKEFLAWLYNESPVSDSVVTNDRWGSETLCKHGGYYTCADRFNPGVLQPHKWENCFTLDRESWGYRRNAELKDYLSPDEMIKTIVQTVSCGGNALINVGPTKEGMIVPIEEERLLQLGQWLEINGEGIYNTEPWKFQNDTLTHGVWFTARATKNIVYAITLTWPKNSELHLEVIESTDVEEVTLLGSEVTGQLEFGPGNSGIKIQFPNRLDNNSEWAWTLKIQFKLEPLAASAMALASNPAVKEESPAATAVDQPLSLLSSAILHRNSVEPVTNLFFEKPTF